MLSDLEITKLCADSIGEWGWDLCQQGCSALHSSMHTGTYDPLHNDAQVMQLVKEHKLHIDIRPGKAVSVQDPAFLHIFEVKTLRPELFVNRAICNCVALIEKAKRAKKA